MGRYSSEVRMGHLQVIEEELNTLGRQILARQLRNDGGGGGGIYLTGPCLKPCYLLYLIQMNSN